MQAMRPGDVTKTPTTFNERRIDDPSPPSAKGAIAAVNSADLVHAIRRFRGSTVRFHDECATMLEVAIMAPVFNVVHPIRTGKAFRK